jgi:hypothetical protein
MLSVQPAGEMTLIGLVGIKSSPGTQLNQNVPTFVVPMSSNVMSYCQVVGVNSVDEIVALASSLARTDETEPASARASAGKVRK